MNCLIENICKRLKFENKLCTDSNIINKINELNIQELRQVVDFGYVLEWMRDESYKSYTKLQKSVTTDFT
jgi:hypothetical protein